MGASILDAQELFEFDFEHWFGSAQRQCNEEIMVIPNTEAMNFSFEATYTMLYWPWFVKSANQCGKGSSSPNTNCLLPCPEYILAVFSV